MRLHKKFCFKHTKWNIKNKEIKLTFSIFNISPGRLFLSIQIRDFICPFLELNWMSIRFTSGYGIFLAASTIISLCSSGIFSSSKPTIVFRMYRSRTNKAWVEFFLDKSWRDQTPRVRSHSPVSIETIAIEIVNTATNNNQAFIFPNSATEQFENTKMSPLKCCNDENQSWNLCKFLLNLMTWRLATSLGLAKICINFNQRCKATDKVVSCNRQRLVATDKFKKNESYEIRIYQ